MAEAINHKYSHTFMTSSLIKGYQRKLAIQYRYGLLPTYKLLKRYKKADRSTCPLCGQEDGGHHAVSACGQLSGSVTKRHNNAGTAIVEAIYAGSRGGELLTADVGLNKRRKDQGLPSLDIRKKIPAEILPPTMPPALKQQLTKHSIPDAMLYKYDHTTKTRSYVIVEIKYCRDTKPEDQEARATEQHKALEQAIKTYDPIANVQYCTLMLGVSGTIFTSFLKQMQDHLGVSGPQLDSLAKKLHVIAVEGLSNVWKQRRALINNLKGSKPSTYAGNKRGQQATPQHRKSKKHKS